MKKIRLEGKFNFCNKKFMSNSISRHLSTCKIRKENIAKLIAAGKKTAKYFHIKIEGRYNPIYWLHIGVPISSKLEDIDEFLRNIWLECCGHLSAFEINGIYYNNHPSDWGG